MRDLACLIPSRTDAFLQTLFESMEQSERGSVDRCFVGDNGLSADFRARWRQASYVTLEHPFVFASAILF